MKYEALQSAGLFCAIFFEMQKILSTKMCRKPFEN